MKESKTQLKVTGCQICSCFDLSRDAYYRFTKRYNKRLGETEKVLEMGSKQRKEQPRKGSRIPRVLQNTL